MTRNEQGFVTEQQLGDAVDHAGTERAELRQRVAELEQTVDALEQQLRMLRAEQSADDDAVPEPAD